MRPPEEQLPHCTEEEERDGRPINPSNEVIGPKSDWTNPKGSENTPIWGVRIE